MIEFKKIRWRNFLATGNNWTEIDLDRDTPTLVVGENGSGKSTLLDAVCFVLFDKPFRKVNKTQLVNTVNGKDCAVEVEFLVGRDHYRVTRTVKSVKNSGGDFDILENGEEIKKEAKKKDAQEFLENEVLRLNYNSFTQVVILGSSVFVPFMQLPAGKRREVIEDLLDIRIFGTMNTLLKDRVKENKEALEDCRREIEIKKEKIAVHRDHVEEMKKSGEKRAGELEEEAEEKKKEADDLEKECEELEDELEGARRDHEEHDTRDRARELESLRDRIKDKRRSADKEIRFYSENDECPECHQEIDQDFKNSRIEEKRTVKEETEKALEDIGKKLEVLNEKYDRYLELSSRIENLQKKTTQKRSRLSSLREQVDRILSEAEETRNKAGDLGEERRKIENLEKEVKEVESTKNELTKKKRVMSVALDLLKDGGIKSEVIRHYVPFINSLVNYYLECLDFFVNFELDEEFNETIRSRHRDDFTYESFSEGEKARIDLSLLFAWRSVARKRSRASTNLLILDEVFDGSLDSSGCDEVTRILSTVEDGTSVFVITHKTDQMLDKFQNVMRFEKIKNFSVMTEER